MKKTKRIKKKDSNYILVLLLLLYLSSVVGTITWASISLSEEPIKPKLHSSIINYNLSTRGLFQNSAINVELYELLSEQNKSRELLKINKEREKEIETYD